MGPLTQKKSFHVLFLPLWYLNVSLYSSLVLEPYKYAGYPMLIKTIRMETTDSSLFLKKTPLLPAASELAFHTINCSALNVEELRRESGIEVCSDLLEH